MSYSIGAIRRAFCIFFTSIAIGVGTSASLSELAFQYHAPNYIYPVIWIPIMAGTILGFKQNNPDMFKAMSRRFTQSVKWSSGMKAITGICWALPFTLIPLFPDYYSYLILLGIGLGNTSTYLITRKVNGTSFTEQMIVGLVSLAALPVIILIGLSHAVSNDMLQFLARLSIAIAYGAGGSYIFQLEI
jgi:hypothetical protein